ncbi:hypothetical protein EJ04DRAFT_517201 [Polyplosphaeria fusca]|uniref:Uncharacterized protein n=1 Tax=Polyplosphaeria fusca TaxID=682080 RepID=A0A9P4QMD5_9PLEO|nr:hypothetical protein EJ04DRAFT_517201 [Polyplosphaeria fusca]
MNTKQFLAIGAFVATVAAAPLSARANDITGSTACIIRGDPSKLTDEQIHQMCSGIGPKNEVMEAFVAGANRTNVQSSIPNEGRYGGF